MTTGPLLGKMIRFALPLMLSGILQLLYNAADLAVVGQFAGKEALAAVGATGSLTNLLTNLFLGMSLGASVVMARARGAKDPEACSHAVHTAITLAGIGGIVLLVIGVLFSGTFLTWMDTPADVLPGATLYMQIYFAGMPFTILYNFSAGILRAVGDTKRPLYFLTLAGLVNVGLNLVFVIVFHMGVAGVALATIIAQAISMMLVLRVLLHGTPDMRLNPKKLHLHGPTLKKMLYIGLPSGIQNSLFAVSNVIIQSAVNSFGSVVMAGTAAASSVMGFIFTVNDACQQTDMTFTSQNMGAGKPRRVKRILWLSLGMVTVASFAVGITAYLLGPVFLAIYNSDPAVIAEGLVRLAVCAPLCFTCGWMHTIAAHLRGMGSSIMPMIVSIAGICGIRLVWIFTYFAAHRTPQVLYYSYPLVWISTSLIHLICYYATRKKLLPKENTVAA